MNKSLSMEQPAINFEFRFGRELDRHNHELSKRISLTLKFVDLAKGKLPGVINLIQIYPVARAGKSGSEVFYLDLFIKSAEFPKRYIAKFQNIKSTKSESESARLAGFASICGEVIDVEHDSEDLGLLVYDLAKISDHVEFRNYFLDINYSDEQCSEALTSAYDLIGKHPNNKGEQKTFLDDYDWYINRKSRPLLRVESFEGSENYEGIASLAKKITSHYRKIVDIIDGHIVYPYLVHGDLHARNLMLSAKDSTKTELIDFGWVHYGHPAKDFSLMEITLKNMLLHEFLNMQQREAGISLHLPITAFERLEKFLCDYVFDLPSADEFIAYIVSQCELKEQQSKALRRVYTSVQAVRSAAKLIITSYCEQSNNESSLTPEKHYLISNFLIALGLNGFEEVEPVWTLIGLDIVGEAICQN